MVKRHPGFEPSRAGFVAQIMEVQIDARRVPRATLPTACRLSPTSARNRAPAARSVSHAFLMVRTGSPRTPNTYAAAGYSRPAGSVFAISRTAARRVEMGTVRGVPSFAFSARMSSSRRSMFTSAHRRFRSSPRRQPVSIAAMMSPDSLTPASRVRAPAAASRPVSSSGVRRRVRWASLTRFRDGFVRDGGTREVALSSGPAKRGLEHLNQMIQRRRRRVPPPAATTWNGFEFVLGDRGQCPFAQAPAVSGPMVTDGREEIRIVLPARLPARLRRSLDVDRCELVECNGDRRNRRGHQERCGASAARLNVPALMALRRSMAMFSASVLLLDVAPEFRVETEPIAQAATGLVREVPRVRALRPAPPAAAAHLS